jgi:hypothetical protein
MACREDSTLLLKNFVFCLTVYWSVESLDAWWYVRTFGVWLSYNSDLCWQIGWKIIVDLGNNVPGDWRLFLWAILIDQNWGLQLPVLMWHHVNYMKSNCTDIICSLAALWLHFWSSCKTECFCNCPNWWWNFRCSETVGYLFLSTASTVSGILLLRNSWAFVSDRHTCYVCLVKYCFLRNTNLVILYYPCYAKVGGHL